MSGIFIGNVLLAELVGTKIFSFSALLEPLTDAGKAFPLQINMSVGVLIWPFAFILSDITNEYFGKAGVRKMTLPFCSPLFFICPITLSSGTSMHNPPGNTTTQPSKT